MLKLVALACLGAWLLMLGVCALVQFSVLLRERDPSFRWREHSVGVAIDCALIIAGCFCIKAVVASLL